MSAVMQTEARAAQQAVQAYSRIEVTPIGVYIGAEVRCGNVKSIDDATIAEVRAAWLEHLVILIRGQQLTMEAQLAFSSRFGESEKSPQFAPVNPYISVISNVVENGKPIGSLGDGEAVWHTDMSNREIPPNGSFLHALEVPAAGGETGFLNMYHALETMSPDVRARIEGRTIRHDGGHNSGGIPRRGVIYHADHPIVRTHPETKRNALYLGRRPHASINGLPSAESEELLDQLWAHATRPEFAWHHSWKVGDILIWDNRCAMHHRNPFDGGARRIMHRSQVVGARPVFDPQAQPAQRSH